MRALEGRVCAITGAGRGIGREHALLFASEGARVVVNDLGGTPDGTGADRSAAQAVVDEIAAAGGEAVAHTEDISSWDGARTLTETAVDAFGRLDVLVNNAGILRDAYIGSMSEDEWDAVLKVHLKGHFAALRHAVEHWRGRSKAGEQLKAAVINTSSGSGHLPAEPRAGQLRRGQGRDRGAHAGRRGRAWPLRRARQRDRAGCAHPADARHSGADRRDVQGAGAAGRVRPVRPAPRQPPGGMALRPRAARSAARCSPSRAARSRS